MTFSPGASDLNLSNSSSGYPYVTACTARMADRIGPGAATPVRPVGNELVPVVAMAGGIDSARRNAAEGCSAAGPADCPASARSTRFTDDAGRADVALAPRTAGRGGPAATVAASPSDPSGREEAAASPMPPINAVAPSAAERTPAHSHRAPGAAPTCRFIAISARDTPQTLLRPTGARSERQRI